MRRGTGLRRILATGSSVMLAATGCAFHGVNSLPLPGTVGRGPGATTYHVEVENVGTMESNSPVMVDDVIVGSIANMKVRKAHGPTSKQGWIADVEISVEPGVVIPANAVAAVGQTSLLGSMHLELNTPPGQQATGRLEPGATIPLDRSMTYPSTERTLSSLSAVVNGGGLGQIGEVIHNFNVAFSGRAGTLRDLLNRLDKFVGTLDDQRDNIVASIQGLNRLAIQFADQHEALSEALRKVPPALDVLIRERPRFTAALEKLGTFSDTANKLINDAQADLVTNLKNLEPSIRALADVGPTLDTALAGTFTFPFPQNLIDRGARGDYFNLWAQFDLSIPRLKRGLFLGTHWGSLHEDEPPAPGEPYYLNYTFDPLRAGVAGAPLPVTGPPPGPPLPGPPPSRVPVAPWLTPTPAPVPAPTEAPGPQAQPEGGG